ncbi:MAG TPA: hypothetical protein VHD62_19430 [Opitutaceae bacterium]|nr:hypothetical protein [Opitutaceae bacterium]
MTAEENSAALARRARQKNTVVALSLLLIVAGLLILFVLRRVPLPLRILVGLTDLVGGSVLLVLVRQKFKP